MIWRWLSLGAALVNLGSFVVAGAIYLHPPRRDAIFQVHVRCLDPTSVRFE